MATSKTKTTKAPASKATAVEPPKSLTATRFGSVVSDHFQERHTNRAFRKASPEAQKQAIAAVSGVAEAFAACLCEGVPVGGMDAAFSGLDKIAPGLSRRVYDAIGHIVGEALRAAENAAHAAAKEAAE